MKVRALFGAAVLASSATVAMGLVGTVGVAAASPAPSTYTCTGGDLATGSFTSISSGTYARIVVRGVCNVVPNAVIHVVGNITVDRNAVFDAQSAPSTITVGNNVNAAAGSLLGLGCLPNPVGHSTGHPCTIDPTESSDISIDGSVNALDASAVLISGITVKGTVTLVGSEGTATVEQRATAIPWSIKDNTIGHGLVVGDMTPIWIGVLDNSVAGNVTLFKIHITDGLAPNNDPTPTIFVASNTVGRNLACYGLGPYVSGGFAGEVNVVGGESLGQCANLKDE